MLASRIVLLIGLPTTMVVVVDAGAVGFCLDQVPDALQGTGFAAVSSLTREQCTTGGFEWCPLSVETMWLNETDGIHAAVEYYFFSACCNGKQGRTLIPDSVGLPTCRTGMAAEDCTRMEWQQRLINDLIGAESGYDFQILPSTRKMNPRKHSGPSETAPCICGPTDPNCTRTSEDGSICLVCETMQKCSDTEVSMGINFFKLHTVDLKTSAMKISAWLRQEWYDPRLRFNEQCYGGMDYFEILAESGSLENSRIWTPDAELYNNEESIWLGSFPARHALVYACPSMPGRGSCGYVWWSRPGIMSALCKYKGLVKFPYDDLSCELEISPFSVDGRYQDLTLRSKDNGVAWVDKPGTDTVSGLTAGSQFQDYRIEDITSRRQIVMYDCCPDAPYPTLLFNIKFSRSNSYYVYRLVLPAVSLALLSFIAFWMDPTIGERLGFGITVILAMVANDVTASSMMPVCSEKVLMDYLSMVCQLFGGLSLCETGLVLHLYNHDANTWGEALIPRFLRQVSTMPPWRHPKRHSTLSKPGAQSRQEESKELLIRKQMYRQIFYLIDQDCSGTLDLEEIDDFGRFMVGSTWNRAAAVEFINSMDLNSDGALDFEEFVIFCEGNLAHIEDPNFAAQMCCGFIQIAERRRQARQQMWQMRANRVDQFARWLIPSGFVCFLVILFSLTTSQLESLIGNNSRQVLLTISGLMPLVAACAAYAVYAGVQSIHQSSDAKHQGNVEIFPGRDAETTSLRSKSTKSEHPLSPFKLPHADLDV